MGRGGQEGSLLSGIWGFHLFSSAARGPTPVPELFNMHRGVEFNVQQSRCHSAKELEFILKPNHPVHKKKHLCHSVPVEKCVTTHQSVKCWKR